MFLFWDTQGEFDTSIFIEVQEAEGCDTETAEVIVSEIIDMVNDDTV